MRRARGTGRQERKINVCDLNCKDRTDREKLSTNLRSLSKGIGSSALVSKSARLSLGGRVSAS